MTKRTANNTFDAHHNGAWTWHSGRVHDDYGAYFKFWGDANTGFAVNFSPKQKGETAALERRIKDIVFAPDASPAAAKVAAASPVAVPAASSKMQVFSNPQINGVAVDRCLNYAAQCNQPAADRYCALNGFTAARDFKLAVFPVTTMLGDGKRCGGNCGGFAEVTCVQ